MGTKPRGASIDRIDNDQDTNQLIAAGLPDNSNRGTDQTIGCSRTTTSLYALWNGQNAPAYRASESSLDLLAAGASIAPLPLLFNVSAKSRMGKFRIAEPGVAFMTLMSGGRRFAASSKIGANLEKSLIMFRHCGALVALIAVLVTAHIEADQHDRIATHQDGQSDSLDSRCC